MNPRLPGRASRADPGRDAPGSRASRAARSRRRPGSAMYASITQTRWQPPWAARQSACWHLPPRASVTTPGTPLHRPGVVSARRLSSWSLPGGWSGAVTSNAGRGSLVCWLVISL